MGQSETGRWAGAGIPGPGPIPDEHARVEVQQFRPLERSLADANVTIDWTLRDNVRAQLRVLVKRILRRHGYPPDRREKATQTVLEQSGVRSEQWAAA